MFGWEYEETNTFALFLVQLGRSHPYHYSRKYVDDVMVRTTILNVNLRTDSVLYASVQVTLDNMKKYCIELSKYLSKCLRMRTQCGMCFHKNNDQ